MRQGDYHMCLFQYRSLGEAPITPHPTNHWCFNLLSSCFHNHQRLYLFLKSFNTNMLCLSSPLKFSRLYLRTNKFMFCSSTIRYSFSYRMTLLTNIPEDQTFFYLFWNGVASLFTAKKFSDVLRTRRSKSSLPTRTGTGCWFEEGKLTSLPILLKGK